MSRPFSPSPPTEGTAPRPKVINIDHRHDDYAYEQKRISALGADLVLQRTRSEDEIIASAADADIVLVESSAITARVIAGMARCRALVMYGVGYNTIDVAAASQAGIVVAHAADYCTEEVADHAAALLLASARRITTMDRTIRAGGWYGFPSYGPLRRLSRLTLGLVGLGRIARGVAVRMAGFGVRILATDPYLAAPPSGSGVEIVDLDRLLRESDLISLHVLLTAETRGLLGEAQFRAMKPTALIVNTSRGAVIDEPALIRALREKWIAGAALDVFATEPLPISSPLRGFDQVILTPHYGATSEEAEANLRATVADSVEAILKGFWPPFPVNPKIRPRFPLKPWAELATTEARAPS